MLPKPNLDLLSALLNFFVEVSLFADDPSSASGGNKMYLENIATVIAPNILWSSDKDNVEDILVVVQIVKTIFTSYKTLFKVFDFNLASRSNQV